MHDIWSLSDSSRIRTHNHLVCKWTLDHLAKLASLVKWFSVYLQAKWLWVRIPLLSLNTSGFFLLFFRWLRASSLLFCWFFYLNLSFLMFSLLELVAAIFINITTVINIVNIITTVIILLTAVWFVTDIIIVIILSRF